MISQRIKKLSKKMTRQEFDKIMGNFIKDKLNLIAPKHVLDKTWKMQGCLSIQLGQEITAKTFKEGLYSGDNVTEYFENLKRRSNN